MLCKYVHTYRYRIYCPGLESGRLNFHSDSEDDLPGVLSRHLPDFAMSLCGRLSLQAGVSPEQFEAHQLSYGEFVDR